jgi:hypothetical protein
MSSEETTASRPRLLLVAAAAAGLALVAAVVGVPGGAVAEESASPAPMQERAHRHAEVAPEMRAEHLAELAEEFGVDADALVAALAAVRAELDVERESLRGELADLDRDERRDAMMAFAEARRGAMAAALAELGVDPDALAEHRAGHERPDRERGPQMRGQHRMAGPHGQV